MSTSQAIEDRVYCNLVAKWNPEISEGIERMLLTTILLKKEKVETKNGELFDQ